MTSVLVGLRSLMPSINSPEEGVCFRVESIFGR
jgi:hypothetical protein